MTGILPVNKYAGITSHTATSKIKRLTKEKCGHFGTLDPMVMGVLPVLIGKATKLSDFMITDKQYKAVIQLGLHTDTLDITGNILQTDDKKFPDMAELENALKINTGKILQTPPQISAIKIGGVSAYKLARKGIEVPIAPRSAEIFSIILTDVNAEQKTFSITVDCSKGTYIRTLAKDIAESLGTIGTLKEMTRTYSGGISLENCVDLEEIEKNSEKIQQYLIPPQEYFKNFPRITIPKEGVTYYLNGGIISLDRIKNFTKQELYIAFDDNEFLGLAAIKEENIKAVWNLL